MYVREITANHIDEFMTTLRRYPRGLTKDMQDQPVARSRSRISVSTRPESQSIESELPRSKNTGLALAPYSPMGYPQEILSFSIPPRALPQMRKPQRKNSQG